MFDFLKKKLSESVKRLTKKVEEQAEQPEKIEEKKEIEKELEEKIELPGPEKLKEPEEIEKFEEKEEEKFEEEVEEPIEIEKIEEEVKEEIEKFERPGEIEKVRKELEKEEIIKRPEKEIGEIEKEKIKEERKGFFRRIKERLAERELSARDIDDFFDGVENDLLEANLALEVVEFLRKDIKNSLVGKPIKRGKARDYITEIFENSLFKILDQGEIDLEKIIRNKKPACLVFLGFNGSGKTSSIAKIAQYLKNKGYKPLIAAGDTFRAASIEQLEVHGERLGVAVIKHKYGADSAAVIFDARKHAEAKKYDAVLADTAGRVHTDKNLMDELEKVVRVNKPDLKILVIDSMTGNDAVEQARQFNEKIGVDAVIMTKVDVNKKGGSIFSVCYAIKKPILFLGIGQKYEDLEKFEPREFVKGLLE